MPKGNLVKFQTITSGSAAGNLTSAVTNIQRLDDVGIQVNITGTPTGTLQVQVSADYVQDFMGNVTNAGTWINLNPGSAVITSGDPTAVYFDLELLSAPWVRLTWTATGGTGTINAFITAKAV